MSARPPSQDTQVSRLYRRTMSAGEPFEYPRDLAGYGRDRNILHGDATSEAFLSDVLGAQPWPGQRHMNVESMYEYGSRAGFWRLWRLFRQRQLPATVFGVATALVRNREAVAAMQ